MDACPTEALKFMEESEAKEYIKQAEQLHPQTQPHVYYLNLPKRFIAGTVYDPQEKEVVIGASVTLAEAGGKQKYTAKTDSYGDFEFEKLAVGKYNLTIEKGKTAKVIKNISTQEDVSLGDIPLS